MENINDILSYQRKKVVNPIFWIVVILIILFSSCSKDEKYNTELNASNEHLEYIEALYMNNVEDTKKEVKQGLRSDLIHCDKSLKLNKQYAMQYPYRRLQIVKFLDDCKARVKVETGKCTGIYICKDIYEIEIVGHG